MPIYQYEPVEEGCKICGGKFEINRPLSRPPLTECPVCRKPVKKCITGFNTPHLTKPLSMTDAKKAGFTVLHKRDQGVYEKQ